MVDDLVAPISVMKYFQSIGYQCKELDVDVTPLVMNSISSCPVIDGSHLDSGDSTHYTELWEWLGAIACNIDVQ